MVATLPSLRKMPGPDLGRLTELFHALSDATRIQIVQKLLVGEQCVCNLTDSLDAAQSRLSFHMRVLREAGLVADRRDGRWVYYTLVPGVLGELESFFSAARERATKVSECCK